MKTSKLKPSQVRNQFWIYEEDLEFSKICPLPCPSNEGKWMMFFDSSEIDEKWERAVTLYYQGKLTGIHALEVSTADMYSWVSRMKENFRNSTEPNHVIFFYCGPCDRKSLMIEIFSLQGRRSSFFAYKICNGGLPTQILFHNLLHLSFSSLIYIMIPA